jgi:hypothetical protein
MALLVGSAATFAGCEAFTAHSSLVARAAGHELSVERLGEILAVSTKIPLERDVIERLVGLWVDYSLLAERLATGDSLLDSATVVNALWTETQQQIVTHYHDELIGDEVVVSRDAVDSAYRAGDHRLIHHILIRTDPDLPEREREAKWARAARLRELASSGPEGWAMANRENEDSASRVEGGSLGVIERGETVQPFEDAAFALEPGEVSPVIESDYGFHIVRRPLLDEVWKEFEGAVRQVMIERKTIAFIGELEERWQIAMRPEAPALMRQAAANPAAARESDRTLGTYSSGEFKVSDLARWLKALPPEYTAEVIDATDEQLFQFGRGLIRNIVLEREAREAGHGLNSDDMSLLRGAMERELAHVRQAMGLDSALHTATSATDRSRVVGSAVDSYLEAVTNDLAQLAIVPPFLAEQLRREMKWSISASGINRALERGQRARSGMASTVPVGVSVKADSVQEDNR